jgi:hypothetical protein
LQNTRKWQWALDQDSHSALMFLRAKRRAEDEGQAHSQGPEVEV